MDEIENQLRPHPDLTCVFYGMTNEEHLEAMLASYQRWDSLLTIVDEE